MNVGGILMMGIGMVFLAVGFIMFPICMTATDSILAYSYTPSVPAMNITDADFTGLTQIVGIVPLLILLGFVSAGVITGFLGFKITSGAREGGKMNPGSLMMLGLSIVFVAIGLIIFPVVLDGISSVVYGGGTGISATYVGLEPILLVTPLIVLIAFISAAVITGFFGVKSMSASK